MLLLEALLGLLGCGQTPTIFRSSFYDTRIVDGVEERKEGLLFRLAYHFALPLDQ